MSTWNHESPHSSPVARVCGHVAVDSVGLALHPPGGTGMSHVTSTVSSAASLLHAPAAVGSATAATVRAMIMVIRAVRMWGVLAEAGGIVRRRVRDTSMPVSARFIQCCHPKGCITPRVSASGCRRLHLPPLLLQTGDLVPQPRSELELQLPRSAVH